MWRPIICLCAALTLGLPAVSHAQYYDNDRQNPKEYTNQQSQPERLAAYVLSPLGFALEWGVTRPLHYIATETFLAPVLGGEQGTKPYVPPVTPLPPEAGAPPVVTAELPPPGVTAGAVPAPAPAAAPRPAEPGAAPVPVTPPSQPVLH